MSTRQRKYRAWDPEDRCFTYFAMADIDERGHIKTSFGWSFRLSSIDPELITEYTGLRDKEGREVYDGDLPGGIWEGHKVQWCPKCHGWSLGMVEVEGHCGQCDGDYMWLDFVDDVNEGKTTIIGNIYEP